MKKKLKIFAILGVSLVISAVSSNTVFLAATPYVNKPFLVQLIRSPGVVFQSTRDYIASIGRGREGIKTYQQTRIQEYTTAQSSQGTQGGTAQAVLPPPTNSEEFEAQGYTAIGNDSYTRENVAANTIEIYFGEDAEFEKRTLETAEGTVEAWVPL